MRTLSSIAFDSSTDLEDIATALGMNWDSVNQVAYVGNDATRGFYFNISGTSLQIRSYFGGATLTNTFTIVSPLYYLKNDADTACIFGGTYQGINYLSCLWAEAHSATDNNTHYMYINQSNISQTGGRTIITDNGYVDGGFFSLTYQASSVLVSFAPLVVDAMTSTGTPSVPWYSNDLFIQIMGPNMVNYQILELDGYDYITSAVYGGSNRMRVAMRIGVSS